MKRTLALFALLAAPLYAQTTTIGDLPNATSVTATDDFACDQGATTRACTALQVKNFIITYFDTESEFEALVTDITNMIVETEINSESDLEGLLADVTDVLTNNDTITADALNADAVDALTEIAQSIKTASNDTDPLVVFTGSVPAGSAECMQMNSSGQASVTGSACGAGGSGAFSDASDPVVLNTTTKDVVVGTAQKNTSKFTVDGEEDVVQVTVQCHSTQTTNPECFIVEDSTGAALFSVEVDGTVNMSSSDAPTIVFRDSDSVADPPDDNATISGNLTNTGDGTENMDVLFRQQMNGTLATRINMDADGSVLITDFQLPTSTDCSAIANDGWPCWESDADTLWVGDGSAPPTEIGAGSGDISDVGDCNGPACFTSGSPDAALTFDNATSGTVTLQTVTGALGTVTVSLPAETGTVCTTGSVCTGYEGDTHASEHEVGGGDLVSIASLTGSISAGQYGAATIDGDDVNSNIAGRSLTLTAAAPDTLDLDAEIYTFTESIVIEDPVTGHSELVQFMKGTAFTITRVACSTDTGTATIQFDERVATDPNTDGDDVMTAQLVCDSDQQVTTSFTNAGIAARVPVNLDIDAVASSPTQLRIFVEGTMDD